MGKMSATAKIRRKARRRRKIAAFFRTLFLLVMLCIILFVVANVCCKVKKITFVGESSLYTADQIVASCGVEVGDSLFGFTGGDVKKTLQSKFPMLGNISIKRVLPDTLEIQGEDVVPNTGYLYKGKVYLYGDSGLVVDVVAEGQQPAGVTIVSGVEIEPVKAGEKLNFAKEQDQDTVPELIGQIIDQVEGVTSIDLANRGNITVYVGEQYVIYFGTNTQIDYKLQMINAVLQKQSFTGWTYLDASNAGKVVTGIYTPPAEQTEQAEETEQTEQTNQGEQQTQTEEENAQTEE